MKEKALPEGWVWKRLGEVVDFFYGYPFDSSKFNDEKRGCPLIRIRDLIKQSTETYYDGEYDQSYLIEKGDILIGMDGEFNIVRWEGITALLNQRNCKLTVKSDLICEGYLFRVLISILKDIEASTPFVTVKHLSAKQLNSIYIPLPPLPVQRQIVAVLEEAEALKLQRQEADALTGALLQSVFYEMFGDPVKNEKGWKETSLGEVCSEIYRYPTFYGFSYSESGVPVIRIANILYSGGMDSELGNYVFIKEEISEKFPRTIIEYNDIVMAVRGDGSTVKRIGIVNTSNLIGANMSPNLIRIKANQNRLNPYYLFGLMTSDSGQKLLEKNVSRTAKKTITGENIKKIQIPLPPLALQQQFARIVEEVERIRERQAESGREIEALCGGLMQRAFGGELAV